MLRSHKKMIGEIDALAIRWASVIELEIRKVIEKHPRMVGFVDAQGLCGFYSEGDRHPLNRFEHPKYCDEVLEMIYAYDEVFGNTGIHIPPEETESERKIDGE